MDIQDATLLIDRFDRTVSDARWRHAARREHEAPSFNVFNLTRRAHFEVTTHSAFLAALLDPYGSHCQGTLFLDAFLRWLRLGRPALRIPDAGPSWTVEAEYAFEPEDLMPEGGADKVGGHETVSGQIDLLLRAGNEAVIVIENKIWARDQETQLYRYARWLKAQKVANGQNGKALIYLTVFGTEPAAMSWGDMTEDERKEVIRMSHRRDVAGIIAGCLDQIRAPAVHEVVQQYVATISGRVVPMTQLDATVDAFFSDRRNLKIFADMGEAFAGFQERQLRGITKRLEDHLDGPGNFWGLEATDRIPDTGYSCFGFTLDEQFKELSGKIWVGYLWRRQGRPWLAILRLDRSRDPESWTSELINDVRPDVKGVPESTKSWIWYLRWDGWPNAGSIQDILDLAGERGDKVADAMAADLRKVLDAIAAFVRSRGGETGSPSNL